MLWCRVLKLSIPLLPAVSLGALQSWVPLFLLTSEPTRTWSGVSPSLG